MNDSDLNRLAAALAPALQRHLPPAPAVPEPSRENRHSDDRRDVNVERSGVWMDYKTLTGGVGALAVSVWWWSGQFSQMHYEIREFRTLLANVPKQFEATLKTVADSLSERIVRLETGARVSDPDRYTRTAHDLWCLETEKLNRDIGWECAPLPGSPPRHTKTETMPTDYYPEWSTKIETKKDRVVK